MKKIKYLALAPVAILCFACGSGAQEKEQEQIKEEVQELDSLSNVMESTEQEIKEAEEELEEALQNLEESPTGEEE